MSKSLHHYFAAALLCGTVGLVVPAYAAGDQVKHSSTRAAELTGKKLAQVDRQERRVTAELNRKALMDTQQQQSFAAPIVNEQVASQDEEEFVQVAFLEDDE